jgi:SAM-dependent methyltransferase
MSLTRFAKSHFPWRLKIMAKLVLARIPASPDTWRRLSVFRHGEMEDPKYAWEVAQLHVGRARTRGLRDGFVALELGPGDTVSSALINATLGASKTILVDVAPLAARDPAPYRNLAAFLSSIGLEPPDLEGVASFEQLLQVCKAEYLTGGLKSLEGVPTESVDLVWSHAVLEHVRRAAFAPTIHETRRVLRQDGFASHRIDLRDHLAEALNSLRFRENVWESGLMASSGFYTNRLRCSQLLEEFKNARFVVAELEEMSWPSLPTERRKLAVPFRTMAEDDLLVFELDVLLRPS